MTIPFIRDNDVKPARIEVFNFDDFSGGLNNRSTPMQLKTNEAMDISNMTFVTNGGMEKRWGTELYDALKLTSPITYMDVFRPINTAEVVIRATDSEVYAGLTKIADVAGKIQGVNYIGNYYFVDGSSYYVYDGTKVWEIVNPPHAYLSANANAGTAVLTLVKWDERITTASPVQLEGINGVETAVILSIDSVAKTVTLTGNLSKNFLADELVRFWFPRNVTYYEGTWEEDSTLSWKWYEPCDHELNDEYKGECFLPTNCSCIQLDSERLFLAGDPDHPHEIYITDINNAYYAPVNIGMQCPPNGDKIKDLIQFDNAIVVGRGDDFNAIYGETSDITMSSMFHMKKLDTHTGLASTDNARLALDYMFFLGSDLNIYAMRTPRADSESLSTMMLNKDKITMSQAPINVTTADLDHVPAIFHQDEYMFIIKDMVVVYNYVYRAWTLYHGLNASYFVIKDNDLLIGTKDGATLKKSAVYSDRGVAIECYYKSGQYHFGAPIHFKDFLDVYIVSHAYDGYDSSLQIANLVDYHEVISASNIKTVLAKFGTAVFGDILISNNLTQSDNIPINLRGRVYMFVYGNDVVDEPMKVYQITGTYKVRGTR